ncbi:MAG: MFS transporter [Lachnospiraceae bacterium]|nr:MFS transporter [Lachnospiraceae bacterium]
MNKKRENTFLSRCAYGVADIYGGGAFVIITTFFTVFLTKALGMPPALAGTIPLIGKVWDAITDPVMGNITDRTKSRFGSKRFYMLIGSFISAITFILLWIPVEASTVGLKYIFYMLMYILFSTGFTIVMVPYNALLPDMVDDYTVRGRYTGVRMAFSAFGNIVAGLGSTLLINDNTDAGKYMLVALIFGVVFCIAILLTFFGTWEKEKPVIKIGLKESLAQSFTVYKSRSFKMFLAIFVFGQVTNDFVTGLAVYYVDDVLNRYGGFMYMMGVILLSQFMGMLIFNPIMAKTNKKMPILIGFPIRMVATLIMIFFSHEGANFGIILFLTFIIGLGMASSSVTIYAILTDMPDVDELITSINRPGTCSGMATFVRKITAGLSISSIGLLLSAVGYDENLATAGARQALSTQTGVAYIYIFVPVVLMIITIFFTAKFPMGKREFDIVRREVARRKGADDSVITPEEIEVCEKVTGFKYDELWNRNNALKLGRR